MQERKQLEPTTSDVDELSGFIKVLWVFVLWPRKSSCDEEMLIWLLPLQPTRVFLDLLYSFAVAI